MQINPILLFLFGELLLVTTVVSIVLIVTTIAGKRRDRAAARKLISRIKEDESRRKEETKKIIGERYGIRDEKLKELLSKIDREEKRFYQTLVNLYLKRDAAALGTLNVTFEGTTEPYRSLELPVAAEVEDADIAVTGDEAAAGEGDEAEVERLLGENLRLSEELKTTMESMGKMLKEYSTMYGGESSTPDPKQMAALLLAEEGGEPEEEALVSEGDEPVVVESSEMPGDEASVAATEEPVKSDPDPDDIDSLIDDAALQRDNKEGAAKKESDDQTLAQERIESDPSTEKDGDWGDLEIMPEDDALPDLSSDGKKE